MDRPTGARRTALCGLIVAAALILSYVETLIPLAGPLPGMKLGLANSAVLFALCALGVREAAAISLLRAALSSLLFAGPAAAIYSLAGAALSFAAMALLKRGRFGLFGVSAGGAVFHNVGQLAAAALLMRTAAVWSYLPYLSVVACVTGGLNAAVAAGALGALGGVFRRER